MAPWHSTHVLTKALSCRLKRTTAPTSHFRNNFCVAGSSSRMRQHRGPDPNTPQDVELLLLWASQLTALSVVFCLPREGHGPPAGEERWKIKIKPHHNTIPRKLGSLCLKLHSPAGVLYKARAASDKRNKDRF